jgi:hypothetical protein
LDHVHLGDIQQEYGLELVEQIDTELVAHPKFRFNPEAKPFVPGALWLDECPSHDTVANHKVETIDASFDPAVGADDSTENENVEAVELTQFEPSFVAIEGTVDAVKSNSVPSYGKPTIYTEADSSTLTVYRSYLTY